MHHGYNHHYATLSPHVQHHGTPLLRLAAVLRQQQLRQLAAVQLFARHAAAQRRLLQGAKVPWRWVGALGGRWWLVVVGFK